MISKFLIDDALSRLDTPSAKLKDDCNINIHSVSQLVGMNCLWISPWFLCRPRHHESNLNPGQTRASGVPQQALRTLAWPRPKTHSSRSLIRKRSSHASCDYSAQNQSPRSVRRGGASTTAAYSPSAPSYGKQGRVSWTFRRRPGSPGFGMGSDLDSNGWALQRLKPVCLQVARPLPPRQIQQSLAGRCPQPASL